MTPELINEFIAASGPETSLWRVPGGGVPIEVWEDWNKVDWTMDFCNPTSAVETLHSESSFLAYPNPTENILYFKSDQHDQVRLYNCLGKLLEIRNGQKGYFDLEHFSGQIFFLKSENSSQVLRIMKT